MTNQKLMKIQVSSPNLATLSNTTTQKKHTRIGQESNHGVMKNKVSCKDGEKNLPKKRSPHVKLHPKPMNTSPTSKWRWVRTQRKEEE